jgi:hypothetical protein
MAHPSEPLKTEPPTQPNLSSLLSGYLQRQADAHALGLGTFDPTGEVVPHEAGPVQPVDPRLAWEEAVTAARLFAPQGRTEPWKTPPSWPTLVSGHEPVVALALCMGNFPQLVRNLQSLLQAVNLNGLLPTAGRTVTAPPGLVEWATQASGKQQYPQVLLGAGALRLAKQFDLAAELLKAPEAAVPAEWRPAWANEKAALAWHRGQAQEARGLWNAQPVSVPVHFNRGMAALFLGDAAAARGELTQAISRLPAEGAWYHLARLYLALAEAR